MTVRSEQKFVWPIIFSSYIVAFIFSPVSGGDLTTMLVKKGTFAQE